MVGVDELERYIGSISMTRLLFAALAAAAIVLGLTIGPITILTLLGVPPSVWAWASVGIAWIVVFHWAWRESE